MHAAMLSNCGEPHQLTAAYDPESSRCSSFAGKWNVPVANSEDEVIERSDAIFVCTWTRDHKRLVENIVRHGRHVFCEKPLAFDADDALQMIECVEKAGVVNAVGLILRSTPALLALREMVRDSASGRPMNIVFRDDQYIPIQGMYASNWRADRTKAGRGALLEHSIHDLDLLEWLMGPIDRIAATQEFFHSLEAIEDSVSVLAHFQSGASGTLSSIWHDITSRPSQRRIEIFCERAAYTLEGEWFGPVHWESMTEAGVESGSLEGDKLVQWLALRNIKVEWPQDRFLRAIRGGTSAAPSFSEAWRAHHLADAAYRSAAAEGASISVAATRSPPNE